MQRLLTVIIVVAFCGAFPLAARMLHTGVQGVATQTPQGSGPIVEWLLTSSSITGTTVADISGNGNTGTVVNGPLTFGPEGTLNGSQYVDSSLVVGVSASLAANPTSITSGQSSTLTWSSTNASSCVGSQDIGSGFSTGGATSGTASVSPTQTTTYTVTCN